ncbi:hypothetical protein [Streptomyces sp. TLI_171]|uniref:hypothetical protein n=1 Tax=Streptomyces sp. TLI_171 TaxID=1938859 RepID=UPI000C17F654|nr:hypothetical protein [Streptomyces sp. TLI_171]
MTGTDGDGLTARYAETIGRPDDAEPRGWILRRLGEQYRGLPARINGWPEPPVPAPVLAWFTAALRATAW